MGKYLDGSGLSHLIGMIKTALSGKADSSDLDDLLPKQPASADLPQASTSNSLFPLVLGNTFANNGQVSYLTKANCQSWLGMDDYLPLTGGTLSGSVQISNASNKNFSEKDITADLTLANNGYSSGTRYMEWLAYDKNNYIPGGVTVQIESGGAVRTLLRCRNYKTGETTAQSCTLTMAVAKNGGKSIIANSYIGSELSTTAKVLDNASHGLDSNVTVGQLYCLDGSGSWTGMLGSNLMSTTDAHANAVSAFLGTRNRVYNSTSNTWSWVTNYITAGVNKDGSRYYSFTSPAAARTALELGTAATMDTGTSGTTVALGNHTHSNYYNSTTSRTANTFLAAPNGSAGAATFRKIVAADIPTLNQNTTGSAAKLTTARSLYVALGTAYDSANPVTFDGSAAKALPISGTLGKGHGGTGKTNTDTTYYGAKSLFSGTATTGTVTLSETAANYSMLLIQYRDNESNYSSKLIIGPNSKRVVLDMIYAVSGIGNLKSRTVTISGTSITTVSGSTMDATHNGGAGTTNHIYITQVWGWK